MATLKLRSAGGRASGDVEVDDALFGIEPNLAVMHQVVTAQLAARRAGTQSTKTRADVAGGGAKPWRQKGTGRARQGSIRSPQWRGGGVALGPKPRSYKQRTPKKMIRLALASALSDRHAEGKVLVLKDWGLGDTPSTKSAVAVLDKLGVSGRVLVDGAGDDRYAARFHAQGTATANGLGLLADAGGGERLRVEDRYAWGTAEPLRGLPSVGLLLNDRARALFERVEVQSSPTPSAAAAPCEKVDLENLERENFDALLAAGEALRCALQKGERWEEAAALLQRDPADRLAAWIAPALTAAPEALRAKLRAVLWKHPSCGVRALALPKEHLDTAMRSSCWRLQAAALRMRARPEGATLPSFLRPRRAY